MFLNCGVIHIDKNKISDEEALEISINAGAKDCLKTNNFHEILTTKDDFYKVKTKIEMQIKDLKYSAIEWRALNYLQLSEEQSKKI